MARNSAMLKGISFVTCAAAMLFGMADLSASLGNATCLLGRLLEIPLRVVSGGFSWVIFAAWQLLVPYLFGLTRLLECLFPMTTCGWQLFLSFS